MSKVDDDNLDYYEALFEFLSDNVPCFEDMVEMFNEQYTQEKENDNT